METALKRHAWNPYLPGWEHVPDGEPRVFCGRLYVYGSHDLSGTDRYCAGSYVGWSAPLEDLSDWRFEGTLLEKGLDPLDPDGDRDYYAPDCVQGPDGRYYLYYSIEGSMVISVAVSDTPAGPFSFYGHVHDAQGHVPGAAPGDDYQFDPAVLVDDDGEIYLYSGQSMPIPWVNERRVKGAQVCRLEADMLTMKTPQQVVTSHQENLFSENPFFEASSIRKIDGRYYFIYSPLPNNHYLCYAVSERPDGGFRYGGVLVSNADLFPGDAGRQDPQNYWGNNHGSIVCLEGQYYVFYHRNSGRSGYARQGCAEKLVLRPDGTFEQAEMTSFGLNREVPPAADIWPANIAWQLRSKTGKPYLPFQYLKYDETDPVIDEEPAAGLPAAIAPAMRLYTQDGGRMPLIRNLTDGSVAGYRYFAFDGTERSITLYLRGEGMVRITVLLDGDVNVVGESGPGRAQTEKAGAEQARTEKAGTEIGTGQFVLSAESGWTPAAVNLRAAAGEHALTLVYEGKKPADFLAFVIR